MTAMSRPYVHREAQAAIVRRPDGSALYTVRAGDGRPVVLAHGYLMEHCVYDDVFAQLVARGFTVIAFDQRGHGRSTIGSEGVSAAVLADDYRAILEHHQVKDATLVAHSMGSFLALTFCLRHPQVARARLQRLVLLGATAGAVAVGSLQNRLQVPLVKSGLIKPLWRWDLTGPALIRQLFGAHVEPAWLEETRTILLRQDTRRTLPVLRAMLDDDLYPRLSEVPIDAVIITGDRDGTCPTWHARRLAAELPSATLSWLAGIGHMISYEAPACIVEAVTAATIADAAAACSALSGRDRSRD